MVMATCRNLLLLVCASIQGYFIHVGMDNGDGGNKIIVILGYFTVITLKSLTGLYSMCMS